MSLLGALSIASSGLAATQGQISIVSQNVANANTAGYVTETAANLETVSAGQAGGVRIGITTRVTAPALQASLYGQNAAVSAASTLSTAWNGINAVLGSTNADSGSTGSLTSGIAGVQTALTTLQSDPTNTSLQASVVSSATTLARTMNGMSTTLGDARQSAEDSVGDDLSAANDALAQIGATSTQIVRLQSLGQGTASLEDQRDAAMTALSNVMSVDFSRTANGNMLVRTSSGILLPTNPANGTLSMQPATLSATDSYPGKIPGITLGGVDVTAGISGGSLGAHIGLRDSAIPTAQAELDGFAATTAQRFSAQGLTLFTDANGAVPANASATASPGGQIGFAAVMQVNPAVIADHALVTDGTASPASGSTLDSVATYAFSDMSSAGVKQPAPMSTGLGPGGNLVLPYATGGSVPEIASRLVAGWGSNESDASSDLATTTATQTALTTAIGSVSSVSIDGELSKMVALQNSYAANAKIIAGVQSMFTTLLGAINP